MSLFIGIDIGASFVKGALFNLDSLTITNITKYPSPKPKSLKSSRGTQQIEFELDANLYYRVVKRLIIELINAISGKIEGIVFSSQMHGMVLIDSGLKPVTPFIGWQDQRLLELSPDSDHTWLDLMQQRLKGIDITNTGIKLHSGLMGGTLFWLKENGVLDKYQNAKASFIGDYVASKLTGNNLLVEPTHACGSGIFDVRRNEWNKKLMRLLGISAKNVPPLVKTGTIVGKYKYKNRKIPVYVSIGDLQAAILGSLIGLTNKQEVSINIGTGSQVSIIKEKFQRNDYDIRSYFDKRFLFTVTHLPAGRALNVIINFIADAGEKIYGQKKMIDIWGRLTDLVSNKRDSQGLRGQVSFYENSATDDVTGRWSNISENNWTVDNMFFSALQNMADNYWNAFRRLQPGGKVDRIICSGGLGRKVKPLRRLVNQRFKTEIILAPFEEETLAGLFILSMFCRGNFQSIHEASLWVRKNGIKFS